VKDVGYVSLLFAYVPLIFICGDSVLLGQCAVSLGLRFCDVLKEHTAFI